jgi:hypothetical protein
MGEDVIRYFWRSLVVKADIDISLASGPLPQLTINTLKKAETIEVKSNGMIYVRNLNLERLRSALAIRLRNKERLVIMVETQNGYKSLCNVTKSEMKDGKIVISLSTDDNNLYFGLYKSAKLTFYSHGEKSEYARYYGASVATWDKSNRQLTVNKADQLPGSPLIAVIASIGQKILIIGKDGNGNTNKMVARVKGVTFDNKRTNFELTTKGFMPSGKAATNAVSGFPSGKYHDLKLFQYEEPYEPHDYQNSKTAALSVDGTITKVNNADGTFQVGFTGKGRFLIIDGLNVASENAKDFLTEMSKDLQAGTLAQVNLLGKAGTIVAVGNMTSLKQSKDNLEPWIATFECDYGYQYTKGTKIEEIIIVIKM